MGHVEPDKEKRPVVYTPAAKKTAAKKAEAEAKAE